MRRVTRKEFSDAFANKAVHGPIRTAALAPGVVEYRKPGEDTDELVGLYITVDGLAFRYLATAEEPR